MTVTLAATQLVAGSAGSGSAVNYVILGDELTAAGVDTFTKLASGQLGVSPAALYTVGSGKSAIVKEVLLHNTTAAPVAVAMHVDGTATANRVVAMTIPANGSATYDGKWTVYDASGFAQTAGATGPQGARGATYRGIYSAAVNYVADDIVSDNGTSWICLVANGPGSAVHAPPALPTTSNTWWSLLAAKGDIGNTGSTGSPGAPGTNGVINTLNTAAPLTGGGSASTLSLAISAATSGAAGSMSATDKAKIDAILGTNTGDVTLTAVGSSPNANGATLTGQALTLQPASQTVAGLLAAVDKKLIDDLHYDAVADFGWVGNDSFDNGTLWSATKTALPVGCVLFFATGTYRTTTELTIDVDKRITFKGVSRYSSIIKTTSATANIFNKTVAGWYDNWVDLGFQSSVTKTAGSAITITAGNNVGMNIYKCWITGIFKGIYAVGAQSANLSIWADLDISGVPNGGRGIQIDGSTINVMIHNATINAGAATTSACVEINQSGAVQVTACDWIQGTNVLLVNSTGGAGPQACYFTNVFFDQPQGSVVKVIGTNTANRIKFTQCGIAPTGNNHGIEVNGTGSGAVGTTTALPAGISLVDCDIYCAAGTGTGAGVLVNGCQDINIQNSRITGFNGVGGAGISVIPSAGNQTKVRINGNIIGPNSNLTVLNETGIKLTAGASGLAALSITDNNLLGSTTPINDASTMATGAMKNINNNAPCPEGFSVGVTYGATILTTTDTVVASMPLGANTLRVGQRFTFFYHDTPSLTTATNVRVRIGTAGTTADAGVLLVGPNATAVAGCTVNIIITITAIGNGTTTFHAAGTIQAGALSFSSAGTTLSVAANSTVANFLTVSIASGATNTRTVRGGQLACVG